MSKNNEKIKILPKRSPLVLLLALVCRAHWTLERIRALNRQIDAVLRRERSGESGCDGPANFRFPILTIGIIGRIV
jgi:hypothetical protein